MFESWTGRRSIYLSVTYNTHLPNSHIGFCTSFFLLWCVLCICAFLFLSFSISLFTAFYMRGALRKYKHISFFLFLFFYFIFAQLLTFSMTSGHFQNVYASLFNSCITMNPNRIRMQCSHVSLFHLETRLQFRIPKLYI